MAWQESTNEISGGQVQCTTIFLHLEIDPLRHERKSVSFMAQVMIPPTHWEKAGDVTSCGGREAKLTSDHRATQGRVRQATEASKEPLPLPLALAPGSPGGSTVHGKVPKKRWLLW